MSESLSVSSKTAPRFVLSVLILALFLLAGAASAEKAVSSVAQVMNPASAAAETVQLKEAWRITADDEDVLLGVITDIITDREGNFYLLDSQLMEVQVFSPDGEYLRTIGREGEGPGEFRMAFNLLLLPNGNIGVLQTAPSKIVGLTTEGEPADDFALPASSGAGFKTLFQARNAGDRIAITYGLNEFGETGFTQHNILSLVDAEGKSESSLFQQSASMKSADARIAEVEWDTFRNRWASSPDGRVFSAVEYGEYAINVWDAAGELKQVIRKEYPEHVRSKEQYDRILDIYKGFTRQVPFPNIRFEIEKNWNPIQAIHARPDGTLWVQTSRGSWDVKDGQLGVFDVFDREGKLVRQVTLEGQGDPQNDGYFMVGDRLFVVTDFLDSMMALQGGAADEEADDYGESMEVICYHLDEAGK